MGQNAPPPPPNLVISSQMTMKLTKDILWVKKSLQIHINGMLRYRLKLKKLNNFLNFRSVVCELCRIGLQVIQLHSHASKLRIFN